MRPEQPTLQIRAGTELPSGTYRLGADRHDRLVASFGGRRSPDGSAHPISAWIVALGGLGVSIEELFAAAGVAMEDGPMLGACDIEWQGPLGVETQYTVRGRVVDVEEKSGRVLGRFGLMHLRLEVADPGGALAAVCTASMVLPRDRNPA